MNNITVIVPVHVINDEIKPYLERALKSIEGQKSIPDNTIIIIPKSINKKDNKEYFNSLKEKYNFNLEIIVNNNETDFASQVNEAVKEVKSKYFSILELDDTYLENWFMNAEKYIQAKPEVNVFLNISQIYNDETGKFISFANEALWADKFSDEIGYLDHGCLEFYVDYQLTGGVFKTEDFKAIGGLKPSIKLAFWYEYLLRATHNGQVIYTIPKNGYNHVVGRKESLMDNYIKEIKQEDAVKWIELAKKEFYFTEDRNKTID